MKTYIRRAFALLLASCLLAGFMLSWASATDTTGENETVVYDFGKYMPNGTFLANCTHELRISYGAKTVDWRYEAAMNAYQFRVKELHPDPGTTGKNMFIANNLQFFGAVDWWYALRLRTPGSGKFALTLTIGGDAETNVYFFDARQIEKALGDNAEAYAETVCKDPYLAGGTEAFEAYRSVIGSVLEASAPVMTTVSEDGKEMTGELLCQEDHEYIMVVKYVGEGNRRAQLSSLRATKIGELPEGYGEEEEDTPLDPVLVAFIAVAGVVAVAAVALAIPAVRNKLFKKKENDQ